MAKTFINTLNPTKGLMKAGSEGIPGSIGGDVVRRVAPQPVPQPKPEPQPQPPAAPKQATSGKDKYDPIAYMKQQLENYAKQHVGKIEKSNKDTASTKADTDKRSSTIKDLENAIKGNEGNVSRLQSEAKNLQKNVDKYKRDADSYQSQYNSKVSERNRAADSAANNAASSVRNTKLPRNMPFYGRTIEQMYGKDVNRWPAQYKNQYNNNISSARNSVNNQYSGTLNNLQSNINSNRNQQSSYQNQVNDRNNQATKLNKQITEQKKGISSNQSGMSANNASLQKLAQQQQEIDREIESFQAEAGPKTELGSKIGGTAQESMKAAVEAAKGIAGSHSDVNKANLTNLLNQEAEKIAKTYGMDPNAVKQELNKEQYFAPGTEVKQMSPEEFKEYAGQAMKQDGPTLGPRRLEAGQVVGGTAEDQARLQQYNQQAQQQAQGQNLAQDTAKANYEQSEQQRQQQLTQLQGELGQSFKQDQAAYYRPGENLNAQGLFNASDKFKQFQQGPQQPAQQPAPQPQQPNGPPQPAQGQPIQQPPGSGAAVANFNSGMQQPKPKQLAVGPMGQFNNLAQNAVKNSAQQGFQNAFNQFKTQAGQISRAGVNQLQTKPNILNRPQKPMMQQPKAPAQVDPMAQRKQQVMAQAMGTATKATSVMNPAAADQAADRNVSNRGQNVQMTGDKRTLNKTAGMRIAR